MNSVLSFMMSLVFLAAMTVSLLANVVMYDELNSYVNRYDNIRTENYKLKDDNQQMYMAGYDCGMDSTCTISEGYEQ